MYVCMYACMYLRTDHSYETRACSEFLDPHELFVFQNLSYLLFHNQLKRFLVCLETFFFSNAQNIFWAFFATA